MHPTIEQYALEKYVSRTCVRHMPLRLASIVLVAGLTAYLQIWSWPLACVWALAYLAAELEVVRWWRGVQPKLSGVPAVRLGGLNRQLILRSALIAIVAAVPCLVTPTSTHDNQIVGVLISGAILLVIAAQHSLHRNMFFATAPVAAVAYLWNLFALGDGVTSWIFLAIGVFLVANARGSQYSNALAYADLTRTKVEADIANAAKSRFLAKISHEIRTPLNGILGMAQSMNLDQTTDLQREKLDVIGASGRSLLHLLNDLLDLSKIEADKVELEAIAFNLEDLLSKTFDATHAAVVNPNVVATLEIAQVRGIYLGDPTRIRQIVENLLSNAFKFTPAGEVKMAAESSALGIRVSISDTGIGIPASAATKIFEAFSQADETTTRERGGTGLGLAIAKRLAILMGGDVALVSETGQGSVFTLTLPLRYVGDTLNLPSGVPAEAAQSQDGRQLRVLIAEDNPTNQAVLRSLFGHVPADCTYVENGQQALAAFEAEPWDLILMDIQMPVMDGLAATRAIRALEAASGASPTPIHALTADVMSHQLVAHRAMGIDGHIGKPIIVAELFSLLSEIAERQSSEPRNTPVLQEA